MLAINLGVAYKSRSLDGPNDDHKNNRTLCCSYRGSYFGTRKCPIAVETGSGRRLAMSRVANAGEELKRDVDEALHDEPKSWPALYMRAQIFASQGKYDRAIQDCNEALHLYPGFVEVALLRARINARLGKYAEALKEFNYLISLHPRRVTLARALSDRAWFEATCPNPRFAVANRQSKTRRLLAASWRGRTRI